MRFVFEQVRTGGDRNFGYLLGDRDAKVAVLVDPSPDPEPLLARAAAQGLRVEWILNTHSHGDHTAGNAEARTRTGATVAGGPGHPGPLDRVLADGDRIPFGGFTLRAWHVPGHIPDHLAFLVEDFAVGLTGDLLFVGKVGGTASAAEGRAEWASLQRLLAAWPAHATIWPGHDYGARPSTTLDLERRTNPFLQCPDLEAFLRLKAGWADFKARHGLR